MAQTARSVSVSRQQSLRSKRLPGELSLKGLPERIPIGSSFRAEPLPVLVPTAASSECEWLRREFVTTKRLSRFHSKSLSFMSQLVIEAPPARSKFVSCSSSGCATTTAALVAATPTATATTPAACMPLNQNVSRRQRRRRGGS